jgi:hypothetical protein
MTHPAGPTGPALHRFYFEIRFLTRFTFSA